MNKSRQLIVSIFVLCAWLMFAAAVPAGARDRNNFYIGANVHYSTAGGKSFQGDTYLTNGFLLYSVPQMEPGLGYGIVVGKNLGMAAFEIEYIVSSHDSSHFDPRDDAAGPIQGKSSNRIGLLNVRLNHDFSPKISGGGLIGMAVNWLKVDNCKFNLDSDYIGGGQFREYWWLNGGVVYRGFGARIGGFLNVTPVPAFSAVLEAYLHILRVSQVGNFTSDAMALTGLGLGLNLTYNFGGGSRF